MPNILMFKFLGGLAIAAILSSLYFYIHHDGYIEGKAEIQVVVDDLKAKINAADTQSKLTIANQEKINHDLKIESDKRVSDIKRYYSRMLHTGSQASASTASSDNQGNAPATTKQTITGCPAEVEQRCALDANSIDVWLEWADRHGIPIGN